MQVFILIGTRIGPSGKEVDNLYTGTDGVALGTAAEKAAESKKYVHIGKLVNPQCTPMPIEPHQTKGTTPNFPRLEKLAAKHKNPTNPLDKAIEATRKGRATTAPKSPELKGGKLVRPLMFEEFVANGGDPAKYPPEGFEAIDSDGWKLYQAGKKKQPEAPAPTPVPEAKTETPEAPEKETTAPEAPAPTEAEEPKAGKKKK